MKVWVFQTMWDYSGGAEITKVFNSKEKAEKWQKRMIEICDLHNQYHSDGTVTKNGGNTSTCPEIIALVKEAGNEDYLGQIIEMEVS